MAAKNTRLTDRSPDYAYWSKMTVLTKDEAIALLLGMESSSVDLKEPLSLKNDEAKKLQKLLLRAFESGAFPNPARISPEELVSWATSNQLLVPKAFIDAVKKQGRPFTNWRLAYESVKAENVSLRKEAADTNAEKKILVRKDSVSGLKKEIKTLQKILLGVAVDKFHFDPHSNKTSVPTNIASAVFRVGLKITADTVRRHLTNAAEESSDEIRDLKKRR